MKRLISLSLLLLLFVSSCDSPLSDLNSTTQKSSHPDKAPATILSGSETVDPDSIRKALWQEFKTKNGSQWRINWNKQTGLPSSLYLGLTEKGYSGNAQEAARSFLSDHNTLLGVADVNQLRHIKTQTHRGVRHVTFQQVVKQVPVYEAQYKVHIRSDGRVDMANGTYYPDIDISGLPSMPKSQAVQQAQSDISIPEGAELQTRAELVIYPGNEHFHLAWKLTLFSEQPVVDWLYIVDAHSGEILYRRNRMTHVSGDGDVYPTHPDLSNISNRTLYRLNGNGNLEGTYVDIVNDEDPEAYSGSNSFQYGESNTHFDEVSLYYHIDQFRHNFIGNLDDGSLGFTQTTAHAHTPIQDLDGDGDLDPNAWFSRNDQELYFNDEHAPAGTQDFAKEDKVIYHEYSHAVIYDIESGIESEYNEEGAISEGVPDYFAGAATSNGRTIILDYAAPAIERDMTNPEINSYADYEYERDNINPIGNVPPHLGGEFISAVLWDLRNTISASQVDFLVYDALYRVTGNPDFMDFRAAILTADYVAYGGINSDTIEDTFHNWGIGPSSYDPPNVIITGPGWVVKGQNDSWQADVSQGESPFDYQWELDGSPAGLNYHTFYHSFSSTGYYQLKVTVTDNQNNTASDTHTIQVQ